MNSKPFFFILSGISQRFSKNLIRHPLSYIVTIVVSIFLTAQPIKKSFATDTSIILWTLGLFALLSGKVKIRELAPYRKTILAGFAFFLAAILSVMQSPYVSDIKILEPEFRLILFPLAIVGVFFSGMSTRQLIFALLLGSVSYAWITYEQSGGFHLGRRIAGDENPVGFGNGAFLLAVTSAYFSIRSWISSRLLFIMAMIAATLYLYAAVASGTRGSFLAVPLIVGYFIFHYRSLKAMTIGVIACLILSVVIYNSPLNNGIKRALTSTQIYLTDSGSNMNSTGLRFKQWETALCIAAKNPLLGIGAHQFRQATMDPQLGCDFNTEKRKIYFTQAHSLYFNTIATMGYAGLLSILLFGLFLSRESMATAGSFNYRHAATIIVLTIAGYSLTVDAFFIRFIADKHLTLLAIILGIFLSQASRKTYDPDTGDTHHIQ